MVEEPQEALMKLLLENVVMLPQVNRLAWKEAKRMAIVAEARRICAQVSERSGGGLMKTSKIYEPASEASSKRSEIVTTIVQTRIRATTNPFAPSSLGADSTR